MFKRLMRQQSDCDIPSYANRAKAYTRSSHLNLWDIYMTKSISSVLILGAAALSLTACSNETASTPADEAVKKVETTTVDAGLCTTMGPQTPRDISSKGGLNTTMFPMAPSSKEMNLCNIHTHTNAEHKGPGFEVFVNDTDSGGYACNGTADLTEAEKAPYDSKFKGVKSGDTIEVHWVHTSCDATPGEGLGACVPETCENPTLRVETQVFLLVNDRNAPNFMRYAYLGNQKEGLHQPRSLPKGNGKPVVFRGSTTGPSYTESVCSPAQVTWSVRPRCQKLDIASLDKWSDRDTAFNEKKSHGVRQLVTAPELLSEIK